MSISSNEGFIVSMERAGRLDTSILTHGIVSRIDVPVNWPSAVVADTYSDSALLRQRISELLQYTHNNAPKGKSPEFYEGLAYALSTMEDRA